jgi:hypothetical protein
VKLATLATKGFSKVYEKPYLTPTTESDLDKILAKCDGATEIIVGGSDRGSDYLRVYGYVNFIFI